MKKLETGNIGIGNTSILATIGRLLAAVVLLVSGGCQSMKENGMLSPRSGELFQTTKMGTGVVASSCVFPTALGWLSMQSGCRSPSSFRRLPLSRPSWTLAWFRH